MLFYPTILIFGIAVIVQFFYYLSYFKLLENFTIPPLNTDMRKVSVLICAHNEERGIVDTINSILKQDYGDFEVIVVVDRSTDKTLESLEKLVDSKLKILNITEVKQGISPKKNAITRGIEASSGDFILLTDADCIPNSDRWITDMCGRTDGDTDLVLGYSPYYNRSGLLNRLIQFDTFLTGIQYLSFALKGKAYMGVGRNMLVRKKAFDKVNGFQGFDHILAGDDDILVQKIASSSNVKICIAQDSFVNSCPKKLWSEWYSQKRRHVSVGIQYSLKNKLSIGLFQQSLVWMYLFFFICLLVAGLKSFTLIMLIVLMLRSIIFYGQLKSILNLNVYIYVVPFLEMIYIAHFAIIGVTVLIRKKHTWN